MRSDLISASRKEQSGSESEKVSGGREKASSRQGQYERAVSRSKRARDVEDIVSGREREE
jgi:hypothetical protein